jgi:hypothetical protein
MQFEVGMSYRSVPRGLAEIDLPVKPPGRSRRLLRDKRPESFIESCGMTGGIPQPRADGYVRTYGSWHDIREYHEYQFE